MFYIVLSHIVELTLVHNMVWETQCHKHVLFWDDVYKCVPPIQGNIGDGFWLWVCHIIPHFKSRSSRYGWLIVKNSSLYLCVRSELYNILCIIIYIYISFLGKKWRCICRCHTSQDKKWPVKRVMSLFSAEHLHR